MRRLYVLGYTLIALSTVACFIGIKLLNTSGDLNMQNSNDLLKLSSQAFGNNAAIPAHYSCKGDNISPPLDIEGVPADTASLALIVHDPDAPNGDFTHWLVWNIDPSVKRINENSVPSGAIQGTSGFGDTKYGGPCPPSGTHHYIFELYSLDSELDLPTSSGQTELKQAMQGHILDQTILTGLFGVN